MDADLFKNLVKCDTVLLGAFTHTHTTHAVAMVFIVVTVTHTATHPAKLFH